MFAKENPERKKKQLQIKDSHRPMNNEKLQHMIAFNYRINRYNKLVKLK